MGQILLINWKLLCTWLSECLLMTLILNYFFKLILLPMTKEDEKQSVLRGSDLIIVACL